MYRVGPLLATPQVLIYSESFLIKIHLTGCLTSLTNSWLRIYTNSGLALYNWIQGTFTLLINRSTWMLLGYRSTKCWTLLVKAAWLGLFIPLPLQIYTTSSKKVERNHTKLRRTQFDISKVIQRKPEGFRQKQAAHRLISAADMSGMKRCRERTWRLMKADLITSLLP